MSDAYRLPTHTWPTSYHIELLASPDRDAFEGKVTIELDVRDPTDTIELHAKDLNIDQAVVDWPESNGAGHYCEHELDEQDEIVRLKAPTTLPAGEATLELTYRGPVSQDMAGLYLSRDGDEVCLATQCEATDARRIFPCFDEPAYKARIQWTITTDPGYRVLANGPLTGRREDPERGTVTWAFAPTRPISSYLAACTIGNFATTNTVTRRDVPFEVWALGGKEDLGRHANNFAADLLPWYEDYFGVAYPYRKYDQVAVPSFSFGAMENVGLVVFRASLLLMDEESASWRQQKAIDRVVSHEFAHMWFGNLVTMRWWDDLWLNEAFAEWIAHRSVDELVPEHQIWFDFEERTSHALATDALRSTHAIYHPVETPEEAVEMFDAITYGKGSAVLRMLEAFLTTNAFRAGLRSYMDAFAEDNAAGNDLWDHLAQASDQPVREIMGDWIGQPGHPVVTVEAGEAGEGTQVLELAQQRFLLDPSAEPRDQRWLLPVVLRYEDDEGVHEQRTLLEDRTGRVQLDVQGELRWCHANAGNVGFYRTDPRGDLRDQLVENLDRLEPLERLGFLRDQWDLVRAGRAPVGPYLDLLDRGAEAGDHYAVVEEVAQRMDTLDTLVRMDGDEEVLEDLQAWVREAFAPGLEELGLEPGVGEDPPTRQKRASVLRAMAAVGRDSETTDALVALADREREDPKAVDANLAGLAVGMAARAGDEERYEAHLSEYKQRRAGSFPPQEVDRYMYSLAAFEDGALVQRTTRAFTDELVPKQSVGPMLRLMLGEPHAQDQAWDFVTDHWDWVRENLGEAWVVNIVEAAGSLHPDRRKAVVAFFDEHLGETGQQAYGRTKERLAVRAKLLERLVPELGDWLAKR